jgi:hypothetical protein
LPEAKRTRSHGQLNLVSEPLFCAHGAIAPVCFAKLSVAGVCDFLIALLSDMFGSAFWAGWSSTNPSKNSGL